MEQRIGKREVAVQLSGIKKMYKLGQIGGGTLQADLQSWWARKRGKEDPNAKIGQEQRLVGQTFMALNGIDLTVYKGEALGIIGGNGAGKSTMLKLLSRVTAPTDGTIEIHGRVASMLEVGTGFNGEMTGRENVYMNGAILGMTKAEIDAKMEDIIEFSEVRDFIDTPVKRYSSGMYVKLAFSVAAHLDSEIMIMDEVLAVGDMAFQKKCLDKMREAAKKEGRTVLYVSHNMNTIRQLCDRCVVLDKGKVAFEGDVEGAIAHYMQRSDDLKTTRDYSNYERPAWVNSLMSLLYVEYMGKENVIFSKNEKMKLLLRWKSKNILKNIGFRMEILSFDDVPQASFVLYDICSCVVGDMVECLVEVDINQLVDADYKTYYTFFQKDAAGNNADIDWVPGLYFRKSSFDSANKMVWNPRKWGYVCLHEPIVLMIEKCEH